MSPEELKPSKNIDEEMENVSINMFMNAIWGEEEIPEIMDPAENPVSESSETLDHIVCSLELAEQKGSLKQNLENIQKYEMQFGQWFAAIGSSFSGLASAGKLFCAHCVIGATSSMGTVAQGASGLGSTFSGIGGGIGGGAGHWHDGVWHGAGKHDEEKRKKQRPNQALPISQPQRTS